MSQPSRFLRPGRESNGQRVHAAAERLLGNGRGRRFWAPEACLGPRCERASGPGHGMQSAGPFGSTAARLASAGGRPTVRLRRAATALSAQPFVHCDRSLGDTPPEAKAVEMMINFFFSSQKQLFSKSNLHSPNLGPLLGLGFRVWRLGSRDKGLGFRV